MNKVDPPPFPPQPTNPKSKKDEGKGKGKERMGTTLQYRTTTVTYLEKITTTLNHSEDRGLESNSQSSICSDST